MKIGSLVRLLDVEGNPLPEFMGLVIQFPEKGKVRVHWMTGGDNTASAKWEFHRLQVLSS